MLAPADAWAKKKAAVVEEAPVADAESAEAVATEAAEEAAAPAAAALPEVAPASKVTDRIFLDIKFQGVNAASAGNRASNLDAQAALDGRVVIGLFGEDAPETGPPAPR